MLRRYLGEQHLLWHASQSLPPSVLSRGQFVWMRIRRQRWIDSHRAGKRRWREHSNPGLVLLGRGSEADARETLASPRSQPLGDLLC